MQVIITVALLGVREFFFVAAPVRCRCAPAIGGRAGLRQCVCQAVTKYMEELVVGTVQSQRLGLPVLLVGRCGLAVVGACAYADRDSESRVSITMVRTMLECLTLWLQGQRSDQGHVA